MPSATGCAGGTELHVLHVFEPPDGGVAQAVLELAVGLRAHGVATEVAGPADAIVRPALAAAGVRYHELPFRRGYGDPAADARSLAEIARIARAGRADVVHAHAAKAGMLGRIAARFARARTVYSPHCLPFVGDVSARRRRGSAVLERAAGIATDALLCVCEDERRLALEHRLVPRERTHVVYNGCPSPDPAAGVDERLRRLAGDDGIVAGAVAVLREQKGLDDLIAAAPAILAGDPRARVAIVGDGPCGPALREQAARLGLDRDPRFALLPYEGPASRHLRALDLYLLPSRWEAFPIGVLEAMACGVPQVATDVGGVREAIDPTTGTLVPAGAPAELAAATLALMADPGRRARMGEASRRRHAERFTVERMVAGTAAVYDLSGAASTNGGRRASA